MKKVVLVLFLFSAVISLSAQKTKEVTIEGHAPFAKGKEVRLLLFDDLLNYHKETCATALVDKNGDFKIKYKINRITMAQLAIQTTKAEFFLEPEKSYHFNISVDENLYSLVAPEEYGGFLHITAEERDTAELNYRINRFSNFFEDITGYFQPCFTYMKNKRQFDTLVSILGNKFDIRYSNSDYYQSYIYYTFATLEHSMYEKMTDSLYRKYLDNEYLQYDNPAYMDFFNIFYDNYLYTSPRIPKALLTEAVNDEADYLKLFNVVGKDPVLQNERIRELVIIKNLGQFYSNEEFDSGNILRLLDNISANTHFPEHKTFVKNLKEKLLLFKKGSPIGGVTLKEVTGADFRFEKLKGKWTYVQFFSSNCDDCIREMMILKELENKYKDSLRIVSVSVDFNFNDFSQFRQSYGRHLFDWHFVNINEEYEWLERLKIVSLPEYILLNPEGKMAERYPATPEHGAATYFLQKFTSPEMEETPLERTNFSR